MDLFLKNIFPFLAILLVLAGPLAMCKRMKTPPEKKLSPEESAARFVELREAMVRDQIETRDVTDQRVLQAIRKVERHLFVPETKQWEAYQDRPLSIGEGQTISQPYIVAYMTEQLKLKPEEKVLEIGTGSGYQAAILGELCKEVYSIEIVEALGKRSSVLLQKLNYNNIQIKIGDGYKGWPEHAPFDAIIVTAAPDHVPKALIDQLAIGGRLVIPVGDLNQELHVYTKNKGRKPGSSILERDIKFPVRFVPMTGEAQKL